MAKPLSEFQKIENTRLPTPGRGLSLDDRGQIPLSVLTRIGTDGAAVAQNHGIYYDGTDFQLGHPTVTGARMYKSNTQTVTQDAWIQVQVQTVDWASGDVTTDTATDFGIEVDVAGIYDVAGGFTFATHASASGEWFIGVGTGTSTSDPDIAQHGNEWVDADWSTLGPRMTIGAAPANLSAGSKLSLFVYNSSGQDVANVAGVNETWLSAVFRGANRDQI